MKTNVFNFGAGPAMLPESVLQAVQSELLDWQGLGISVMEIGHRTPEYQRLMETLEADLRALLAIPNAYHVLFLGSAARTQFSMIPMNLLQGAQQAAYLISGIWSSLAYEEASRLKHAYCLASSEKAGFLEPPTHSSWQWKDDTAYLYYTPNETINGVRFSETPKVMNIPLVADMTSCLLSEPVTISDFGLIFAGAQKNIAIPGLTIVIIRSDLLDHALETPIPTMMDYRTHSLYHSLYATPPTFACYVASKMLQWVKLQGGVEALYAKNCQKAAKLYAYIDASTLYHCAVHPAARSLVNVCFSLTRPELEQSFLARATEKGLYALQGHRMVGGIRASLYNAMPMAGVDALIAFMQDFSERFFANGG